MGAGFPQERNFVVICSQYGEYLLHRRRAQA
jgi:hypothetical protein